MDKSQIQINFISNSGLYNILNRDVPDNYRYSFILYDFCQACQQWPQTIDMTQFHDFIQQKELFSTKELQSEIPQGMSDMYKRRKRMFNIMIPFSGSKTKDIIDSVINNNKIPFNLNDYNAEKFQVVKKFEENESDNNDRQFDCFLDFNYLNTYNYEDFHKTFQSAILSQESWDQESQQLIKSFENSLKFYWNLKNDKTTEVYILLDDFSEFKARYHFLDDFMHKLQSKQRLEVYPNEIIPNQLYLGKYQQAENVEMIKNLKITHVINMTREVPNYHENNNELNIQYIKNPLDDQSNNDIKQFFRKTYESLDSIISSDQSNTEGDEKDSAGSNSNHDSETQSPKILVHCAQGKSRSATIVIMYLMKKFKMTFKAAYEYVKQRRDCIDPNFGFQSQLEELESNDYNFE